MDRNTLLTNFRNLLNDNLPDPYLDTRAGSFVFGHDDEINFGKYMPKLQIFPSNQNSDKISFGQVFRENTDFNVDVYFYTKRGDKGSGDSSAYKNRQLIDYYLDLIGSVTKVHSGSLGDGVMVAGFGTVDSPIYNPDHDIFKGIKPVIFRYTGK